MKFFVQACALLIAGSVWAGDVVCTLTWTNVSPDEAIEVSRVMQQIADAWGASIVVSNALTSSTCGCQGTPQAPPAVKKLVRYHVENPEAVAVESNLLRRLFPQRFR